MSNPNGKTVEPEAPEVANPNDDWKNNPNLDANGNPVEETTPVVEPEPQEAPVETEPTVEPEVPAPTVEPEPEPVVEVNPTIVSQVEKLLTEAGVKPVEIGKNVDANGGKVTAADAAILVAKHGDTVASILISQIEGFHVAAKSKATAQAQARDAEVFGHVQEAFKDMTTQSGADTFKELNQWAKDNVPNKERKEINALLQQGGLAAKYAIDALAQRFKQSNAYTVEADLVGGDKTPTSKSGQSPLSRNEYDRLFRELESKGHVYGQSAELDQLDRRRSQGRKRGI